MLEFLVARAPAADTDIIGLTQGVEFSQSLYCAYFLLRHTCDQQREFLA
jgi:hypothetical protein